MNRDEAYQRAQPLSSKDLAIDLQGAREIRDGWYFPWRSLTDELMAGSKGVIVHKRTGRVVQLGSAFSLERALRAFDDGYPLGEAHLTVTSVIDEARTVAILQKMRVSKVEPEFAHGATWRIPKLLSSSEIKAKLKKLPADFGVVQVYFAVELFDTVKQEHCFTFKLQEAAT
jgi:hypothetical protein